MSGWNHIFFPKELWGAGGNSFEQTDPDYVDKRSTKLFDDFVKCPADWRNEFLRGLVKKDREFVLEQYLKHKEVM